MAISVVINTRNAAATLERTLKSAQGFDEIVVCDMESEDATVDIARRYGCRIVAFPRGEVRIVEPARNAAVQAASNDWVLVVDADEEISPQLREWAYARIQDAEGLGGVFVPRKNFVLNRWARSSYPDYQLRLLRREGLEWPPRVHALPKVKGRTEHIPARRDDLALLHANVHMRDVFERYNRYSDDEVEKRRGWRPGLLAFWLKPAFRFFRSYVLKGGFRYGVRGYISARNEAIYKYMSMVKLFEANSD